MKINLNRVKQCALTSALAVFVISTSQAASITSSIYSTKDGSALGQVTFEDSKYGLLIKPQLHGLPVGLHGFHLHQHPNCAEHGMGAGGHFDPTNTNSHKGPYAEGHLGDLPVLMVNEKGEANTTVLAPRLKTTDIQGISLMIHADGDNYSDTPPLGGGGARIACGKIPS